MTYEIFKNNVNDLYNQFKIKNVIIKEYNEEFESLNDDDLLWEYNNIKKLYKIDLQDNVKQIYLANNITFCWHYKIVDEIFTGGEANIKPTSSMLVDTSKTSFSNSLTDYGKMLYKEGYRFFDSHPHAGDGIFAAIKIEKNSIAETVFMADIIHEEISEMMINYPEYIAHTIRLKGLYDWQYIFMTDNFKYKSFDPAILQKRLKDYTLLFPGSDVGMYVKLYKEKGGK